MSDDKTRVLFLMASPADTTVISVDRDLDAIERAIDVSRQRPRLDLRPVYAPSIPDLIENLTHFKPHVLHFSGHGQRRGGLLLDHGGVSAALSVDGLTRLFRALGGDAPRIVVLAACNSLELARVATRFCACAVGVPTELDDAHAAPFVHGFYSGLLGDRSARAALELGLASLPGPGAGGAHRPWLEVSFTAGDEDLLFFPKKEPKKEPTNDDALARAAQWIDLGLFRDAATELGKILEKKPDEGKAIYYLALAELGGRRPAHLPSLDLAYRLDQRLQRLQVVAATRGAATDNGWLNVARLFWAWIREDYYGRNYIAVGPPSVDDLLAMVAASGGLDRTELQRLQRWMPREAHGGRVAAFTQLQIDRFRPAP